MRILAVTPYAEPEGGGLERYAQAVLSRLAARGHAVLQVAYTAGPARRDERDGVPRQLVPYWWRFGNTPVGGLGKALRTMTAGWGPDVVVAHTPVPSAAQAAWRTARRAGVPFVVTYHAGRLHGSSLALEAVARLHAATTERRMLADATHLIAVSPIVRDRALRRHRRRTTIVAPGVDAQRLRPGAEGHLWRPELLFVAPLDRRYRWKGLDVLWAAFQDVRRSMPQATLRLVGAGDRLEEFRAKAAAMGGVGVPGRLDNAGLRDAYRDAAALVLPSTSDAESFGMVLAEANACGTPVVASNIGGMPGFVRPNDNGLLARPGDAVELAACLKRLLADPEAAAAMGRRGRDRVLREHDWDRLTDQTEAVLRAAAQRSDRPSLQADRTQAGQGGQRVGPDTSHGSEGTTGRLRTDDPVA